MRRTVKPTVTLGSVGPLSRPIDVMNLPPQGTPFHIVATAEECAALARDLKLPALHALSGDYHLTATAKGIHLAGRVTAHLTQTCVVTLEPFDSTVEEDVEVDFAEPRGMPAEPPNEMHDYEPPDEIVNGQVDIGAITAEFLVLGLDPYPRKPGVDFAFQDPSDVETSPFSALSKLKRET